MPYIPQAQRAALDVVAESAAREIKNAGQFNYLLTKLALVYTRLESPCYMTFNEVIGTLENVKQEYLRRIVAPYEDKKRNENGDVFNEEPAKPIKAPSRREKRKDQVDLSPYDEVTASSGL